MNPRCSILVLAASLFGAGAAGGEGEAQAPAEKAGLKIMRKNYEQMTAMQFKSRASLLLVDRKGRTQTRHLRRMSITDEKDQESYVIVFDRPPEIRKTAFLNVEHKERDDDLWMYLPALKKTKRITGTNLRGSWVGTEFTYKDLKREKLEGNRYVLLRTEESAVDPMENGPGAAANKVDLHVIDAFPITRQEKDEGGYSRRRLWIRADNHLVHKCEFYDGREELTKTLLLTDLRPVGRSGKVRAYINTMINRKGVKSIVKFEEISINEGAIPARSFTRRYIEMGR